MSDAPESWRWDDPRSVERSVRRICRAWRSALDAAYDDGQRATDYEAVHRGGGDQTDGWAWISEQARVAQEWVSGAREVLVFAVGVSADRSLWVGAFDPHRQEIGLVGAWRDLVEWRPNGVGRLIRKLHDLADQAAIHWPETPKVGQTIGTVTVGQRTNTIEQCADCAKPIGGNALDPLRRLDGRPYHAKSCFYREWRRQRKVGA